MYFRIYDFFFDVLHLMPGAMSSVYGAIFGLCKDKAEPESIPIRLQRMTGYGKDAIMDAIRELAQNDCIKIYPTIGRPSKYMVNLPADALKVMEQETSRAKAVSKQKHTTKRITTGGRFEVIDDTG